MNSTELHDLFRAEVFDQAKPPFWSDLEIYNYMDDAQKLFCRLGGGIPDGTTDDITLVDVAAGDTWIDLDPKIIKLRGAQRMSDFVDMKLLNFEDLQNSGRPTEQWDYGVQKTYQLDDQIGDMRYLIMGITDGQARLLKRPDKDDQIRLIVERMPLVDITKAGQKLEIRDEHHTYLMLWMKARAYRKQDAEVFDKGKSDDFEAQFRAYCKQATAEKEMRQKKYRLMVYGGI